MALHNHVRKIGFFAWGMLLFVTCIVLTAHQALTNEVPVVLPPGIVLPPGVVPPVPASTLTEHAVLANDSMTGDIAIYEIVIAEVKQGGFGRNIMRPASRKTGRAVMLSNTVTRPAIGELESKNKLSILSRPQIVTLLGQKATIVVGHKTSQHDIEIVLLPIRRENGKILTKIVVKQTEVRNGKEETYQLLELSGMLPTDNRFSLLASHKLGGKELVLLVTAKESRQETVQMVSQR